MREVVTVIFTESQVGIFTANTELEKTKKWLKEGKIFYITKGFDSLKAAKQYILDTFEEKSEIDMTAINYNRMQKYHTITYYCYFDNEYRAFFKDRPLSFLPNGKSINICFLEDYDNRADAIESFRRGKDGRVFVGEVYDDIILREEDISVLNAQRLAYRALHKQEYIKLDVVCKNPVPLEELEQKEIEQRTS